MSHPRPFLVKICGITRGADAARAIELGADRIGFVLAESKRRVDLDTAAAIARDLPDHVLPVGVFVNPDPADVYKAYECGAIGLAQFHGDESPDFCGAFDRDLPWTKALRAATPGDLDALLQYGCAEVLVEGKTDGEYGGTGLPMSQEVLDHALAVTQRMIVLAGGLGPDNIATILRHAWATTDGHQPRGIDASSRLESEPGVKDHDKLFAFFEAIDQVVAERIKDDEYGGPAA